jgi:hypothetical protein
MKRPGPFWAAFPLFVCVSMMRKRRDIDTKRTMLNPFSQLNRRKREVYCNYIWNEYFTSSKTSGVGHSPYFSGGGDDGLEFRLPYFFLVMSNRARPMAAMPGRSRWRVRTILKQAQLAFCGFPRCGGGTACPYASRGCAPAAAPRNRTEVASSFLVSDIYSRAFSQLL